VTAATGGWETWSWDESLFTGTAGYYEQGRLPYAPGLADAFARSLALDGQGRLLDVGCGPGTVTLRLAPLFEAVVGLDPDPGMLARASRAAAGRAAGNATWVRERAEALPAGLGSFRVVTFAASFHWMDRPRVAAAVATMLDPGGAVVHVDAPGYRADELSAEAERGTLPFPPPPDEALDQLRRQYLGSDRRAGQGIRNTSPSGEDQVFQQAGFLPAQTVTVPDQRAVERTADDIVASVFSHSSTAPHLFGDRQQDYEADMRQILARASPSGRFSVRLPDNILRIWQLPALAAVLSRLAGPGGELDGILGDMAADSSCLSCSAEGKADLPPRERVYLGPRWRVAHAFWTALPGWLVVLPRRHVVALDELTEAEAADLGPLLRAVTAALRQVTGCEKTYVSLFAEAEGFAHVHFHVIPRHASLEPELRGPRVFGLHGGDPARHVPDNAMDEVAAALSAALSTLLA
jgi:diadenosine tetraphosphate (Ap4A) HIT family hydrolase/ubiquinone/menaquinone biosynthesis C-methylase UbiE